ncbi:hypothetical protein [Methanobacterium ferruginis]|uniref:hypothetical protein n=1 Tax=Methanobacterium ferruginis TaxID=710191 RepID=UPI0025744F6B|nr:hypothetical protein [Methanobacterium ferruginis]BDZ68608.1 hypothetical protein GCM10025860_20560 [Methanobacterium ferruginis]
MAYKDWVIGGLTPSWVEPDFSHDPDQRTLTLKCAAIQTELLADPMTEIDQFNEIASEKITITELEQGGTNLQVRNGQIISVTDGKTLWERCALHRIKVDLDDCYHEDEYGSVIEYDLVIEYEESAGGGVVSYSPTPPAGYHEYEGLEFYEWYYLEGSTWIKAVADTSSGAYGTEIGYMKTPTFTRPIKKVTVYGSACVLPAKIYCTGSLEGSRDWSYEHDNNTNQPFQKLEFTFNPETAPLYAELYSTEHHGDDPNYGCWLKYVLIEFI